MGKLTRENGFDVACQVNEGNYCESLEMLRKTYEAMKDLEMELSNLKESHNSVKIELETVKEWNKTLSRQLERYARGKWPI